MPGKPACCILFRGRTLLEKSSRHAGKNLHRRSRNSTKPFLKNQKDIGQILENIVYVELLRCGYTVTVGKTSRLEIDFCAQNNKGTEHFQVCYLLANKETVNRKFGAFAPVRENFPKYVLSLDNFDFSRDCIVHRNLIRWLLE